MKNALLLICLASACATEKSTASEVSKPAVTVLVGGHAQLEPRGLCDIYKKASFGGQFTLDKMVTNMERDEFGGMVPNTTLFFVNDVKFGNSPEEFSFKTLGGETDNGSTLTANISMELGKTYILFPEDRGGVLFLSPDAKFTENKNGNFRNGYLLNKAPTKLNSSTFKAHFLSKECSDIRPDFEYDKIKIRSGRSSSKTEVGR